MNKIDYDEKIAELERLKMLSNAKTGDGFPIEIGKTYYTLRSLFKGVEIVIPQDLWDYRTFYLYDGINMSYNYYELFTTKEAALDNMEKFLTNSIQSYEEAIQVKQKSLELLEKLRNEN